MILAIAFNNYEHQEIQILDTSLVDCQDIKNLEIHLKNHKENTPFLIEEYSYNIFYEKLKPGFIKPNLPTTIDNTIFIKKYKYEDNLYTW